MHIVSITIYNTIMHYDLGFENFLTGPLMSNICRIQNEADPGEVLKDFLPAGFECLCDKELTSVLEEACLSAAIADSDEALPPYICPVAVKVKEEDLIKFKQMFFRDHGMCLLEGDEPLVA